MTPFGRWAVAFLVLAFFAATAAWAEPAQSRDDVKRIKFILLLVAVAIGFLCLLLGALFAMIFGLRRNKTYFAVGTALFALLIATVGWFSGVIPVLLGILGVILSGRTM